MLKKRPTTYSVIGQLRGEQAKVKKLVTLSAYSYKTN